MSRSAGIDATIRTAVPADEPAIAALLIGLRAQLDAVTAQQ